MQDLIPEYKKTLRILMKGKRDSNSESDDNLINEMISSTRFSLEYIKLGYHPENRRGLHRRSVSQLTTAIDPMWMQSYASPSSCGSFTVLSDDERFRIEEAMSLLTEQERQAYTLHFGLGFSLSQTAHEMDTTKSSVQTYLMRAEEKIKMKKETSLFL